MAAAAPWDSTSVADEFHVQLGKRLDAAVKRGEVKACINNRSVRWGHILIEESVWEPLTAQDIRDLRLIAGDVLMCEGGEIGRAAVWGDELPEAYFLNTLHRLRSKGRYDPYLLAAIFERMAITGELSAVVGKATLAHLTKENLLNVQLPLPPSDEQSHIVAALISADDLIATLERLIAKKQAIKQGMMQQLFAGRSHAPNRWRECCLGVNLLRPPRYGINAAAAPLRPGIATYIRITDINDGGRFDPHPKVGVSHKNAASYILKTGELVLARTGASVGKSYLYDPRDGELVYAGFLINIAPDARQLNPKFLALFMQTAEYWNWVARTSMRSGQPGINGREYAQMPIALPSIDIQNAAAETFADVDQQIEVLERRLRRSCAIKIGMMQQLLTGRIRLPVEAAS